jgi:CxxC-x17-CxxC domain-containing protein
MGDFNRGRGPRDNNRLGGNRGFGQSRPFDRPRFGGERSGGNRQMHTAVCAQCGKDCQVPFRPREDKPVYCSDCFEQKGGRDARNGGQNRFDRPQANENNRQASMVNQNNYKQDFEMLNAKLEKILRILTPVETPKPIESASMIEEPIKIEKKKAVKKTSKKK